MKREIMVLGAILLVAAVILALYQERETWLQSTGGETVVMHGDWYRPYRSWGIIVGLIAIVTLIIGGYMPDQSSSDTVN